MKSEQHSAYRETLKFTGSDTLPPIEIQRYRALRGSIPGVVEGFPGILSGNFGGPPVLLNLFPQPYGLVSSIAPDLVNSYGVDGCLFHWHRILARWSAELFPAPRLRTPSIGFLGDLGVVVLRFLGEFGVVVLGLWVILGSLF